MEVRVVCAEEGSVTCEVEEEILQPPQEVVEVVE